VLRPAAKSTTGDSDVSLERTTSFPVGCQRLSSPQGSQANKRR
jgi:hypothetical protein